MGMDFFFATPVAGVLNVVILSLTMVGLIQVWRALGKVRQTNRDLVEIQGAPSKDRDTLNSAVRELRPSSPVRRRIEALEAFKDRGAPVDAEILAAISTEEARDAAPLARWGGSTLVLLGLAGTLIGLSLAISGLTGLLAPGHALNSEEIKNAILGIMTPMKVAFSTTLAGVGGAVLVTSAVARLRHQQSQVIRRLEEEATTNWIPVFQTTEESRIGEAVKELEETRAALELGLNALLVRVGEGFDELEGQFRTRARELLEQVSELRDATLQIIGKRREDSLSLADYVETVKATTDELQRAVESSFALLPEIERTLKETIHSEQQALTEALTEHTSAVRPVLEQQRNAAAALADAVASEVARLKDLEDVLERLTVSFEAARGTWEQADRSIEKMGRETAVALSDGLRNTLEAVARLTQEQARSQERVTLALDGFERTYKHTLEVLKEQSRRALNQSQEMVEEIRATLRESLGQIGNSLIDAQKGQGVQIQTGLDALGRELRDLAQGGPTIGRSRPEPKPRLGRNPDGNSTGDGPAGSSDDGQPNASNPKDNLDIRVQEIEEDVRGLE
jgi:hypothetical protein